MKTFQQFTTEAYSCLEEGMSLKDFKANRRKLKRREASADAKKRGHVGKEWYNSGRTYSPDEAKSGRAKMADHERSTRKRSAMDPEGEDSNYSADKTKNPKKLRKQKAMGELGESAVPGKPAEKVGALTNIDIPQKERDDAKARILAKTKAIRDKKLKEETGASKKNETKFHLKLDKLVHKTFGASPEEKKKVKEEYVDEAGDYWHPDPKKDRQISGAGNKARAREDREAASKPKEDPRKLKSGESYMDYAKRHGYKSPQKPKLSDRIKSRLGLKKEDLDIFETSLNRVRSKSEKGGMAIMSAQRGDKSKKENKARSKQLEKDIRGAGLPGPTKVSGRYTENPGTDKEKKVGEKSHVVSSGKKGKKAFKKAITKLGKKYNQDSVLIQKKPKGGAQLVGTNKSWPGEGKRVKVGKMNPGKTGEFDTKVKNKTFTYEEYEN